MSNCNWPNGVCACYSASVEKKDPFGRVWMHCEEGLDMTSASMSRFVMHCLKNNIEIGEIHPFNYRYARSQVSATVRLMPDQFAEFEIVTKGKLRKPPIISLNCSSAESMNRADTEDDCA